ncbi:hypothetical protein F5Y16DRAFT_402789 [Xylariaceae sp. FL0255]|nr:hypothetical protein F5Y16DRAFT_402789 [Xylariaceae sp. FL0255]
MAPWTEETYKALALSFFENGGPYDVEKQQTVADSMAKFGVQVSWDGIRHRENEVAWTGIVFAGSSLGGARDLSTWQHKFPPLHQTLLPTFTPTPTFSLSLAFLHHTHSPLVSSLPSGFYISSPSSAFYTCPTASTMSSQSPATPNKKWDETKNSNLFLAVLSVMDIQFSQESKDHIVQAMKDRGYDDTNWNAIRQHLQKLKKKTPAAGEAGDAPATTTPAKAGKAKAATPKTSRKRKADDTPVAKKAAKKAKKEDDEDVAQPTADDGDEPVPDDDEGTA